MSTPAAGPSPTPAALSPQQIAGRLRILQKTIASEEFQGFNPSDREQFLQQIGFDRQLETILNRLRQLWPDLLLKRRDANSDSAIEAAAQDSAEQALFGEALETARLYAEALRLQATAAAQRGAAPPPPPPFSAPTAWLTAIAEGRLDEALAGYALLSPVEVDSARATLADSWLQALRRLPRQPPARAERDRLVAQIRRIGREPQRRAAAAPPPSGVPAPADPMRWIFAALAVLIIMALALLSGLLPLPSTATPTSQAGASTTSIAALTPPLDISPTPGVPRITSISPITLSLTLQSGIIVLTGANLDQLKPEDISIVPEAGAKLEFSIEEQASESLSLQLAQRKIDRASLSVDLRINGQAVKTFTLISGNPTYPVDGVLKEYRYTGRIGDDLSAPLLDAAGGSPTSDAIRKGDQVEVLDSSVDGWFKVQVRQGAASGATGWVERWLVLNANVPPPPPPTPRPTPKPSKTPTPQPTNTTVVTPTLTPITPLPSRWSFNAVGAGTSQDPSQPASCVSGHVRDRDGAGISGALGNVNNGNTGPTWVSGADGVYTACNLGRGDWTVVLYFVPNPDDRSTNIIDHEVASPITISGTAGEVVILDFLEQ